MSPPFFINAADSDDFIASVISDATTDTESAPGYLRKLASLDIVEDPSITSIPVSIETPSFRKKRLVINLADEYYDPRTARVKKYIENQHAPAAPTDKGSHNIKTNQKTPKHESPTVAKKERPTNNRNEKSQKTVIQYVENRAKGTNRLEPGGSLGSSRVSAKRVIYPKGSRKIFGSALHWVNPTVPGEYGTTDKHGSSSQRAAILRGLQSNEDALDRIFNTVERFNCRVDRATLPPMHNRCTAEPPRNRENKHSSSASRFVHGRRKPDQKHCELHAEARDPIDDIFDSVEHFACRDGVVPKHSTKSHHEKDALDEVFERFEEYTCSRRSAPANRHRNQSRKDAEKLKRRDKFPVIREREPLRGPKPTQIHAGSRGQDHREFNRIPHHSSHNTDLFDSVFNHVEQVACGHGKVHRNGYYDLTVDDDLNYQNSIISHGDSDPGPSARENAEGNKIKLLSKRCVLTCGF